MPEGSIPYASLVESALMGVVRGVLEDVMTAGLDAPHHFYITFRTDHPGVEMPVELRQRYRQEMTIVLQHQFWDLAVDDERFAVTLSFGGRPQRLSIPFAAIKVFADPGVEFGLQFTLADTEADAVADESTVPRVVPVPEDDDQIDTAPQAAEIVEVTPESDRDGAPAASEGQDDEQDKPAGGADIVTLDRFRKR